MSATTSRAERGNVACCWLVTRPSLASGWLIVAVAKFLRRFDRNLEGAALRPDRARQAVCNTV